MKRWNMIGWGLAGIGLVVAMTMVGNSKTRAVDEPVKGTGRNAGKLIVHEWGTFTSFSGSNGVQLDFRPLINEDLPDFVLDRQMQSGVSILAKGRIRARIRMETPVTYFYTDEERTVRASVEFPDGLLTEFYPPVVAMEPKFEWKSERESFGKSKLDWGEILLIPVANLAPNVKNAQTRKWLLGMIEQRILPTDGSPANHYYHARETDSAFVYVHAKSSEDFLTVKPSGDHIEKFLFYRGVGRFEQPLQAVVTEAGRVQVTNPGQQPIRSLFRVTMSDGVLMYSALESLSAGAMAEFPMLAAQVTLQDLQDRVSAALVRENLYPREATAMVKTWADSWFAEEGTRIFYMVPREITDKLLPLTISPAPDETVRVLVGRVEVMPPSVEKQLLEVVRQHAAQRAAHNLEQADLEPQDRSSLPVPAELLKLGRLVEPALVRIRELAKDEVVSGEATILMNECRDALDKIAQGTQSVSK